MAQSGWRLPDDLLRRVRVRCAESGERQNAFVLRALESALADEPGMSPELKARLREQWDSPELEAQLMAESEPYKLPPSEPVPKPAVPEVRAASAVPGVRPARDFVLDPRQAALNKAKKS